MKPPIEPTNTRVFFFARVFRYIVLVVIMFPITYFFFSDKSWIGFTLSLLGIVFWLVEIIRGNQTEDFVFENYENPLQ